MLLEDRENLTFLLIDDDPDILEILKGLLEGMGYSRIFIATGGVEGLALAREHKPDLILLDVMMPGMDGPAVMKELRRDNETADIPVIIQTSLLTEEEVEHKRGWLGNNTCISKPYQREQIEKAIRRALS
jgi:CheY-like chemotaxis protein